MSTMTGARWCIGGLLCLAWLTVAAPARAQIRAGEYVGQFGFYHANYLRAQLRIDKGGKRFKGVLTFRHFKHAIDTTRITSSCEVKGQYDEDFGTVTITFSKWIGPEPDGNYTMGLRQGRFDPAKQLLTGPDFVLALKGTPEAKKLEDNQWIWDQREQAERDAQDKYDMKSGTYAMKRRKIERDSATAVHGAEKGGRKGEAVLAEPPIEWKSLGLRVVIREVKLPSGPATLPYVVAVQENGGAHLGGLQPGDVVTWVKCGQWAYNFIDRQRNGISYDSTYESVGAPGRENAYVLVVGDACLPERETLISVAVPAKGRRPMTQFTQLQPGVGAGAWLTDKVAAVARRQEGQADLAARYNELRRRAFTELRNRPCTYDPGNPYDRKAMPPIVRELAELKIKMSGGAAEEDVLYWRDVVAGYCDEEKHGKLPSFETALFQIGRGKLDPCAYNPNTDYTALPEEDADRRQRRYSRREYEEWTGFDYFLGRLATPAQRTCLFGLIRAQLKAK